MITSSKMTFVLSSMNIVCLVWLGAFSVVSSQSDCNAGPCFPSPKAITSEYTVQANSTCGINGSETFCLPRKLECNGVCDANSATNNSHPPSYINDAYKLETFWKSVNMDRPVFVQIDFGVIYMLSSSIVTFEFELPSAMYFAKSKDYGSSFHAVAYHATDCLSFFNMSVTSTNRRNGLAVECFIIDPTITPSKKISYEPMRDPDTSNRIIRSNVNQTYFLMTNIRLVLVSFVTPAEFDESKASQALKQSLSFTIHDWNVMASCFCNGQASTCQNSSKCACQRNTAGNNCERCLSLYNNKPYQVRQSCEACGCNNHALSCHYNTTKEYGVCDSCSHNTMGDKCELCNREFYRNSEVSQNDTNTCLACACNLSGVKNTANRTLCDSVSGQCDCKPKVSGRTCGTCFLGFWNLSDANSQGCEDCRCLTTGTVNGSNVCDASNAGQCPCKANIDGRTCNKCKDGYYNLTENNSVGCLACGCNAAGSINVTCNSTGGCYCRPRFYGVKCHQIEDGFFVPSVGSLAIEAEYGTLHPAQELKLSHSMLALPQSSTKVLFIGVVLSESGNVSSPTRLTLSTKIPKTAFYAFALRYMTNNDWQLLKLTAELRSLFSSFSCDGGATTFTRNRAHVFLANATAESEAVSFGGAACLLEGTYTIDLEIQPGSAGGNGSSAKINVDSVVILPYVTRFKQFQAASAVEQRNVSFYYRVAPSLRQWSVQSAYGCDALSGFYGLIYGEGQDCSCNATGANSPSVCDSCGGQCACKTNVIGRTCDRCRPDYYNFTSGFGCEDCSCYVMGSLRSSCDPSTGRCYCKPSVIGKQCTQCEKHYYNLNSGNGCSPCNCSRAYSQELQCNDAGACRCKPGVNGAKCDRCTDSFHNLTTAGCTVCNCDPNGSQTTVCNKTTGQCPCKDNSIGKTCNACPSGHYGLGAPHPKGCLECQCSNKTSNCTTAHGWVEAEIKTQLLITQDNVLMDGWTVVKSDGVPLPTLPLPSPYKWDLNNQLIPIPNGFIITEAKQEIYFNAPAKYVKQGRFAYSYSMSFKLNQDNTSFPEISSKGDVILKGSGFSQPIVYRLPSAPGITQFTAYTIKFVETDGWFVGTTQGRRPTSSEFTVVLNTLQSLDIRAKWSHNDTFTRLTDISMKYSNYSSDGTKAYNVETCHCPPQYVGQFCERCAPGYTRDIPNGGAYTECVPCRCNGHSNSCDVESGVCHACQHNTTGNHCQLCADGLYGNAANGTSEDCKPCPCPKGPFSSNQFSPTCYLNNTDGQPTCNNCTVGHGGRRCERCMVGYYGTPTGLDGNCRKCNCNGNVDTTIQGNCDTTTGECNNCGHNTSGYSCEWCTSGFYGNALNKSCSSCQCTSMGTINGTQCNNVTGKCACHPHVMGLSCDRCELYAFNYTSGVGCSQCNCHPYGTKNNSLQCNSTTGICDCRPNVMGDKCNTCDKGFYNVTAHCQVCDCQANYTVPNTTCDVVTGACTCNMSRGGAYYGGRRCDRCETQSVGKPENCRPCKEPCYKNWYSLIKVEADNVSSLWYNVSTMLHEFGNRTVENINSTIQELNRNLTYAKNIFRGAQYNTNEKKDQIDRIRTTIDDLRHRLNESERIIIDAEQYLLSTVSGFNGTVRVLPAQPDSPSVDVSGSNVYADWVSLIAMAESYRNRAKLLNESGHIAYKNITSTYEVIKLANETAALASRQIHDAMTRLDRVSTQRNVVEERLGSVFQAELQNNSLLLEQIKKTSEEIDNLLKYASATAGKTTTAIEDAKKTVKTANETASRRKAGAEKALNDATSALTQATQAKADATNAQAVTAQFKANASSVLEQSQDALNNVTKGINTIAQVINKSRDSKAIADDVIGLRLPVTLKTIKDLATQIKAIEVDSTLINKTYDGAADGLKKAKEVEELSERAINVSQTTLNEVQSIEKSVSDARASRDETERLQQQTDKKVMEINNITQSVETKFSNASSIGRETLAIINRTISTVDDGLKCFNESKETCKTAAVVAERAYKLSQDAAKINQSVSSDISLMSSKVDKLYDVAQANYTKIVSAHNDSVQLLKDVNEAEVLLNEYIQQRKEMEQLKNESDSLESELDTLIRQFDEETKKYNDCGGS